MGKKKSDLELFEEKFPKEFNEWFNKEYPSSHWGNAMSQWCMMKNASFGAYILGGNEKHNKGKPE